MNTINKPLTTSRTTTEKLLLEIGITKQFTRGQIITLHFGCAILLGIIIQIAVLLSGSQVLIEDLFFSGLSFGGAIIGYHVAKKFEKAVIIAIILYVNLAAWFFITLWFYAKPELMGVVAFCFLFAALTYTYIQSKRLLGDKFFGILSTFNAISLLLFRLTLANPTKPAEMLVVIFLLCATALAIHHWVKSEDLETENSHHKQNLTALHNSYEQRIATISTNYEQQIATHQQQLTTLNTAYKQKTETLEQQITTLQQNLSTQNTTHEQHLTTITIAYEEQIVTLEQKLANLTLATKKQQAANQQQIAAQTAQIEEKTTTITHLTNLFRYLLGEVYRKKTIQYQGILTENPKQDEVKLKLYDEDWLKFRLNTVDGRLLCKTNEKILVTALNLQKGDSIICEVRPKSDEGIPYGSYDYAEVSNIKRIT